MATIAKALGPFEGKQGEDVRKWLKTAEVFGKTLGLQEVTMVRAGIVNLKGVLWNG